MLSVSLNKTLLSLSFIAGTPSLNLQPQDQLCLINSVRTTHVGKRIKLSTVKVTLHKSASQSSEMLLRARHNADDAAEKQSDL